VVSVDEAISNSEVWRNSGAGLCSIVVLDNLGREVDKLIRGGQTFQLSTRERQMNQWSAASNELDMFRNGRFTLISPSSQTNMKEVESVDSWTDTAIEDFILQRLGDSKTDVEGGLTRLSTVVNEMSSALTLKRFKEEAAVQDLPTKYRKVINDRLKEVGDTQAEIVEREVVDSRQILKTKGEIPKGG
jgi:hypothetical protein